MAHIAPGKSGCSVACLVRFCTYSTLARNPGRVRVRRVGAPYAPHFAWFLHGFCMNIETCHFDMLVFCTVLHGFCMWNSLFFFHTWNSLCFCMTCGTACTFFCMTRTACTVLHGFCMTCGSTPCPPCFFPVRLPWSDTHARPSLRRTTCRSGGGAVPSGHLTNVPSRHGAERAPN